MSRPIRKVGILLVILTCIILYFRADIPTASDEGLTRFRSSSSSRDEAEPVRSDDRDGDESDVQEQHPLVYDPLKMSVEAEDTAPDSAYYNYEGTYTELRSISTKDGKYFKVDFSGSGANNPSLIPHPVLNGTYIVVAEGTDHRTDEQEDLLYEYACNAAYTEDGILHCTQPAILPVAQPKSSRTCPSGSEKITITGPRFPRIFYGPNAPYFTYEVHGLSECPGGNGSTPYSSLYIQDLRTQVHTGVKPKASDVFAASTEIVAPSSLRSSSSSDAFLFWDMSNKTHAQFSLQPERIIAEVNSDGTPAKDVSLPASEQQCLSKLLPKLTTPKEVLSPATNTLRLTACGRSDATCKPTAENTYILQIIQHQREYSHPHQSVVEPFVHIYHAAPPFKTVGVSQKSLWILGRGGKHDNEPPGTHGYDGDGITEQGELMRRKDRTELFDVVGMSWVDESATYGGFIDDAVVLGFGMQGRMTGGIDVNVLDLLNGMATCDGEKAFWEAYLPEKTEAV